MKIENSVNEEPYWTTGRAARFLGVTTKGLYAMVERGIIPPECIHRLGRALRFRQSELESLIVKGKKIEEK